MRHHRHQQGSVVIVALCFVVVLGIGLAAYMGVSTQAMKLSNRSYVKSVSEQLAEMGLERALLAFNQNYWDTAVWSDQNSTTKVATITFPNTKYGNGVIGSINLRVDHYGASVWNSATIYNRKDVVSYRGVWFLCKLDNTSGTPPQDSLAWVSAPGAWNPATCYQTGDITIIGTTAYRCDLDNSNRSPLTSPTFWTASAATLSAWNASTSYSAPNDLVLSGGTAYRCIAGNANQPPPNLTYWVSEPVIYAEGVATLPDNSSTKIKTQLRALITPAALFPNAAAASTSLTFSAGGVVDSYNAAFAKPWNASTNYKVDDVAFSGPIAYRCIADHSNQAPPNAYWDTSALGYSAVLAGGNTTGTAVTVTSAKVNGYVAAPAATTSPYAPRVIFGTSPAATVKGPTSPGSPNVDLTRISRSPFIPKFDAAEWNSTTSYRLNDVVSSGSDLYLCIRVPNTNVPLTNTSYWQINQPLSLTPGGNTDVPAGIYSIASISLDSSPGFSPKTITFKGSVILNVLGDIRISNNGLITLETGSAEIHFGGRLRIGSGFSGAVPGINNLTKSPKNFALINTATSTFGGNTFYTKPTSPFYGVIYMPDITNALAIYSEIFGAVSAKFVTFPVTTNLHYDTSLRTATFRSIDAPFIITEWRELTDAAERVTLP